VARVGVLRHGDVAVIVDLGKPTPRLQPPDLLLEREGQFDTVQKSAEGALRVFRDISVKEAYTPSELGQGVSMSLHELLEGHPR
jgi:hypothetical protein